MTALKQLGWQDGDPLYLALDDTQVQKRASVMEGVSKTFLHAEKRYANGRDVVLATIIYRGIAIPYALRLWTSEKKCKELNKSGQPIIFRKITDLAADCVRLFPVGVSSKVTVLFDSDYLCKAVIDACNDKGFFYLGAVKSNRVIKEAKDSKKGAQVGACSNGYLANKGHSYNIACSSVKHRIAGLVCYLKKVGTVKVVFCRRKGDNQIVTFATNDLECGVKRIVEIYRNRWQIEVLFKSAKQKLGMGDYQFLKRRAVDKYLHLDDLPFILDPFGL
ncbi:MAG: transposase [Thermoguttaceae bacterium]|nr:transposase [Thermoguttaceae bacterium]